MVDSFYGCRQVRRSSPAPAKKPQASRSPIAQASELHVHRGRFGVAGALVVDEELLDDRRQELQPRLLLIRVSSSTAPLILSRTAVALCVGRRIDDVAFERIDGPHFELACRHAAGRSDPCP